LSVNAGDAVTVTFLKVQYTSHLDGLYVLTETPIATTQLTSINPAGSVPGGLAGSFWGNFNSLGHLWEKDQQDV
jgi:hypothetical protein